MAQNFFFSRGNTRHPRNIPTKLYYFFVSFFALSIKNVSKLQFLHFAQRNGPFSNAQQMNYTLTRELPGVALVNISNG